MNIQIEHTIPSAWDYKFSNQKDGRRITIALNDGTFVRGLFYNKSFASSDGNFRDIYLEESYVLKDDSVEWIKVDKTDGIWISPNSIKWISFMEDEKDEGE